ncbi:MAG TPA: glycoside hydrolase [Blastocatellia bacterium]|nr:glycoside hydrolase [Blastocatellia bacterium]
MKTSQLIPIRSRVLLAFVLAFIAFAYSATMAQQFNPDLFKSLHWRSIGPFRGGRTRAVAGVPSQPNVFYIAQVNGGVWKTDDFGGTWTPIFDDQPTGSVGCIAVAPSDPNIIYVGSGEGLQRPDLSVGDGIYKSIDAGKTWTHLGLRDGQQIPQIAVDPRDANRIIVAVAGHPYAANPERGIFRSTDGGKTFEKVLYKDENIGGADVIFDPTNPDVAYAALWEARQGPWENAAWNGTGGGVYKSTDNGKTWRQLSGGLPENIIQANIAIAPSTPNRLFASVALSPGLVIYRSDDAGETWTRITTDPRPAGRIGGGDLAVIRVDPKNPDVVYSASVVSWKSIDGGKAWTAFRGAPGGDDYQNVWVNPNNGDVIILGSDQGAIITVNGGKTWSSWYNQPTAQMYHVNADNAFPYRLCSGQQESGSACVSSRGNDGEITFREWHPVSAEEYGYVVPDPLDPDIVYGGKLTRYDRRTAQAQNIMPKPFRGADFRVVRTQPIVFSPLDPHTMYFAANTLWKTKDGGRSWEQVSPDLTRKTFDVPDTIGKYRSQPTAQSTQRGVIYTVAPSPLDTNVMWAGTDDGLIHRTIDGGKNWSDVTPKQLKPWQKVSIIGGSHFDKNTAYAAINTLRLDDLRPHIYRTRDGGNNWAEIAKGIPDNENTDVVREDPERKGLLFAGTERAVYVSFDDGDQWQSLRLNMGATSIRDLIIKGDDLCVGTHGRGFWILDNITPLRQLHDSVTKSPAFLFKPQTAVRVRWNTNSDTPLPPDVPAGENPPDGAIVDYFIGRGSAPVTLEIKDASGAVVRRYTSDDKLPAEDPQLNIPPYWVRPPQKLANGPGLHRFLWDLHYNPVPGVTPQYPIAAVYRNTAPSPTSPWAMPATYTVVLTVGGKKYEQALRVVMDPRVKTSTADLAQQFQMSKQMYDEWLALNTISDDARRIRGQLTELRAKVTDATLKSHVDALAEKIQSVAGGGGGGFGGGGGGRGGGGGAARVTAASVLGNARTLFNLIEEADVAPTSQISAAAPDVLKDSRAVQDSWRAIKSTDIPALNQELSAAGLPAIK